MREIPPPEPESTFLAYGGASITTSTLYDGNSRVRQLVDDNGNITLWTYDTLNRQTEMTFHNGSTRVNDYDEASDVVEYTNENGSVFTNTFDAAGRKTAVSITLASGVVGTTAQSFQYDGLSRMTFARDSVSTTHVDVTLVYDSLGRMLEDSQAFGGNTRNVTSEKFTSHPMTQFAFPNGRQITNTYDDLYRRTLVEETSGGADIAAWEFFGSGRVAECVLGNGLIMSFMNNARTRSAMQEDLASPTWGNQSSDRLGYDGAGRMITKRFLAGGINGGTGAYNNTSSLVGQTTVFDKGGNKLYERELHAESRSHLYETFDDQTPLGGYDSLDRLRQYQRGILSTTGGQGNAGGGWVTTPISLPGTDGSRTYDLDGLGNWHHTVFTPVGSSETDELRQHNGLNQITTINDGGGNVPFSYDGVAGASNGNLADDGIRTYKWDALNRLKEVRKKAGDVLIGQYDYDAKNRRIRKIVSNGGLSGTIPNGTTDFVYNSNWQCVEERDGSNDPTKQYVWGTYIDGLLQQKVDINGTPEDQYPLQDLLYRTTALTADSGNIIEAYDCDAYGNTLIFDAAGTGSNWFADDATQGDSPTCDFIFTGRRLDAESVVYQYRMRYYESAFGRFLSRDPMQEVLLDPDAYQYVNNSPNIMVDPSGLQAGFFQADIVAKSFIDGIGPIGDLRGRLGPGMDAVLPPIFVTDWAQEGLAKDKMQAQRRLEALAKLIGGEPPFNQNPITDARDGEYRLYSRAIVRFCCNGNNLTQPRVTLTDKHGGQELGILYGSMYMDPVSITRVNQSRISVKWLGWGSPHELAEIGFQLVAYRTAKYIWHRPTVDLYCENGRGHHDVKMFEGSSYPSRRLWINGQESAYRGQGSFADLWRSHAGAPKFARG